MNNDNIINKYEEKLVCINRVSKTVKGGRIFSFTALTVIGNKNGNIGFGYGKSKEIPIAIKKSIDKANKNIIKIIIHNDTIINKTFGKHICSNVFIKPAYKGTGIIAGGAMRSVFEVSGIKNILAKIYGSTNPINVIYATFNALKNLKSIQYIAKKRNKNINEIL